MARGLVRTDAAHAFGSWLRRQPGFGLAAAARLVDQARHTESPGTGLLVAWLAESGLGQAAASLLPAVRTPVRAANVSPQVADAIRHLAAKHGVAPAQFAASVVGDLVEVDGRVAWRLPERRNCPARVVPLNDDDTGLLRVVVEAAYGAGTRPDAADPLLGRGWTPTRVRALLGRQSGNGVPLSAPHLTAGG